MSPLKHDIFSSSPHAVDEETFVGYVQVGLLLTFDAENAHVDIGYAQTYITETFTIQTDNDAIGALTLSL